jgi:cobalt/nickel transport protein
MGIRANERGEFTIGLPRAGWWGICALEVGADIEHEGKPLSQDAVLWIQVKDMR